MSRVAIVLEKPEFWPHGYEWPPVYIRVTFTGKSKRSVWGDGRAMLMNFVHHYSRPQACERGDWLEYYREIGVKRGKARKQPRKGQARRTRGA